MEEVGESSAIAERQAVSRRKGKQPSRLLEPFQVESVPDSHYCTSHVATKETTRIADEQDVARADEDSKQQDRNRSEGSLVWERGEAMNGAMIGSLHASTGGSININTGTQFHTTLALSSLSIGLALSPELPDDQPRGNSIALLQQATFEDDIELAEVTTYAAVTNRSLRSRLLDIAHQCHQLDQYFAIYISSVLAPSRPRYTQQRLTSIKQHIAQRQRLQDYNRQQQNQNYMRLQSGRIQDISDSAEPDVYLGDLGHFCESVLEVRSWETKNPLPEFKIRRSSNTDRLRYLQDAYEVYYWSMMLEVFNQAHAETAGVPGNFVVHGLHSGKVQLLHALTSLREAHKDATTRDDVSYIVSGIERRIKVLDEVPFSKGLRDFETDMLRWISGVQEQVIAATTASPITPSPITIEVALPPTQENTQLINTSLLLGFILIAIVPGYQGFALSFHRNEGPGSTSDPDFWYLLQSNIMWLMGSVIMVVSMRGYSWLSLAYLSTWIFQLAGFACAVVSMAIFTSFNTGWSNLFAFLASIASAAAVLVASQKPRQKVKMS